LSGLREVARSITGITFVCLIGAGALLAAPAASAAAETAVTASSSVGKSQTAKEKRKRRSAPPTLGMYDPELSFRNEGGVGLEHFFIFWQAFDRDDLRDKVQYAEIRRRRVMITVEPYTKAANWVDGGNVLLAEVARGQYDEQIEAVCTEVASISGAPLVRWGHEMDDTKDGYPWAGRPPRDYVAAYRYFVKMCRELAPQAEFVWAPIGHPGLQDYYPGDDVVDHVGLPLWGYDKADRRWFGRERSFGEALEEKYALVERFDKSVIIAEFGVSGSGRYRRSWLGTYLEKLRDFPLVTAVAYFNVRNPHKWPDGLGQPDWRVRPAIIGLD
jgi:endoglucanase